jgi:hypothetical protein
MIKPHTSKTASIIQKPSTPKGQKGKIMKNNSFCKFFFYQNLCMEKSYGKNERSFGNKFSIEMARIKRNLFLQTMEKFHVGWI